jgi:hypothetical protein
MLVLPVHCFSWVAVYGMSQRLSLLTLLLVLFVYLYCYTPTACCFWCACESVHSSKLYIWGTPASVFNTACRYYMCALRSLFLIRHNTDKFAHNSVRSKASLFLTYYPNAFYVRLIRCTLHIAMRCFWADQHRVKDACAGASLTLQHMRRTKWLQSLRSPVCVASIRILPVKGSLPSVLMWQSNASYDAIWRWSTGTWLYHRMIGSIWRLTHCMWSACALAMPTALQILTLRDAVAFTALGERARKHVFSAAAQEVGCMVSALPYHDDLQ